MANNIRNSDYYRRRAADIRARGGRESLAAQMDNYANNLDAGIYDDNTPPVRLNSSTTATEPAKKTAKQQKVADAPSRYVGQGPVQPIVPTVSESLARQSYSEPPYDGVPVVNRYADTNEALPQRGSYMDYPQQQAAVPIGGGANAYPAPISTTYNGDPEGVNYGNGQPISDYPWDTQLAEMNNAIDQRNNRSNFSGAGGNYGSRTPWQRTLDDIKNVKEYRFNRGYPLPRSIAYNGDPEGVDYTPDYPWERQLQSMNNSIDRRYSRNGSGTQATNVYPNPVSVTYNGDPEGVSYGSTALPQRGSYMDYPTARQEYDVDTYRSPEFELPPMEVTADAPKKSNSKNAKFQLVGEKPSGGSDLTKFYANQLSYVPYEGGNSAEHGSNGLVNRMKDLCKIVPHSDNDGTNSARTASAALDNTPYEGLYNADQFIEIATNNGQLRDAYSKYKPKAGDICIKDDGSVGMVTENGNTIQNGGGKGSARYYITTSDYKNMYQRFYNGTGLKSSVEGFVPSGK